MWFNPNFVTQPAPGTFGNCPAQGPIIGPGYSNVDIGLQKNFLFTESKRLQFRADFLNAFNHPNFGYPNGDISSPDTAPVITSTNGNYLSGSSTSRVINFALRFQF